MSHEARREPKAQHLAFREAYSVVPASRLPIVSPVTSVSGALKQMHDKRSSVLLVHEASEPFRFFSTTSDLGEVTKTTRVLDSSLEPIKTLSLPLAMVEIRRTPLRGGTLPPDEVARLRGTAEMVGILSEGSLYGLFFEDRSRAGAFLAPPVIYVCAIGKHYYPAPPPPRCTVDGSSVGRA